MRTVLLLVSILAVRSGRDHTGHQPWLHTKDQARQKDSRLGRIVFVTYGNAAYAQARERLAAEARELGLFSNVIVETDLIEYDPDFALALADADFKEVYEQRRGGGYWLWKPYVVLKHLRALRDGDVLVYSDAGCSIPGAPRDAATKLRGYLDRVARAASGVLAIRNPRVEREWTKGDAFAHFGVTAPSLGDARSAPRHWW